jgi:RimJ/RimL family protein N-acetyltransferase
MGWIFDPSVHGQGIASEACSRALLWADEALKPTLYHAMIDLENIPSIKLAERLGFQRLPDGVYRGTAIAVFRRSMKTAD